MQDHCIGFIGGGSLGVPIARNLLRAGYGLRVWSARAGWANLLARIGAKKVDSPGGTIEQPGGIVITVVPDEQALLEVTLGSDGILEQLGPGGVHLCLSTISPALSTTLAAEYSRRNGNFLVATVFGPPEKADTGQWFLALSGSPAAKSRVFPILAVLGRQIFDCGCQVSAAAAVRIAVNYLMAVQLVALGEIAALFWRHDLNGKAFFPVLYVSRSERAGPDIDDAAAFYLLSLWHKTEELLSNTAEVLKSH